MWCRVCVRVCVCVCVCVSLDFSKILLDVSFQHGLGLLRKTVRIPCRPTSFFSRPNHVEMTHPIRPWYKSAQKWILFPCVFPQNMQVLGNLSAALRVKSDGESKYFIRNFACSFCSSRIRAGTTLFVVGHKNWRKIVKKMTSLWVVWCGVCVCVWCVGGVNFISKALLYHRISLPENKSVKGDRWLWWKKAFAPRSPSEPMLALERRTSNIWFFFGSI